MWPCSRSNLSYGALLSNIALLILLKPGRGGGRCSSFASLFSSHTNMLTTAVLSHAAIGMAEVLCAYWGVLVSSAVATRMRAVKAVVCASPKARLSRPMRPTSALNLISLQFYAVLSAGELNARGGSARKNSRGWSICVSRFWIINIRSSRRRRKYSDGSIS